MPERSPADDSEFTAGWRGLWTTSRSRWPSTTASLPRRRWARPSRRRAKSSTPSVRSPTRRSPARPGRKMVRSANSRAQRAATVHKIPRRGADADAGLQLAYAPAYPQEQGAAHARRAAPPDAQHATCAAPLGLRVRRDAGIYWRWRAISPTHLRIQNADAARVRLLWPAAHTHQWPAQLPARWRPRHA